MIQGLTFYYLSKVSLVNHPNFSARTDRLFSCTGMPWIAGIYDQFLTKESRIGDGEAGVSFWHLGVITPFVNRIAICVNLTGLDLLLDYFVIPAKGMFPM